MKEFRTFVVLFAIVVGLGVLPSSAQAELCTIDAVPAATLLLPYFEIDLKKSREKVRDVVFSIGNSSEEPTIAHVAMWTDMSLPTINFDIFLTGFDVQTISLADVFFFGNIPDTFHDNGNGNGNGMINFNSAGSHEGSCSVVGGFNSLEDFRNAHTGREVDQDGMCHGSRSKGQKARGYITIDNANACSVIFPNDSGYFENDSSGEPIGVANNVNQLWGDWFIVSKANVQAEHLVSVEAATSDDPFTTGENTFYGRYTSFSGTDQREPLGTTWGARYLDKGTSQAPLLDDTYLLVWRDGGDSSEPFECDDPSSGGYSPLGQTQIVAFDEQEDYTVLFNEPDDYAFPLETQEVRVGKSGFPTPYKNGWAYLNLNHSGNVVQSYVTVRQDAKSRRSMVQAIELTNGCAEIFPFFDNPFF